MKFYKKVNLCTRMSQMKTLNIFYPAIYWTQKVHNDLIFLCSIVLPPVGHSSNYEYHCWNLQDNQTLVRIFIALLRFSVDSPSYNVILRRVRVTIEAVENQILLKLWAFFYVLLTVHLSIFISVFKQFDAQNSFHNKFHVMPLHVSSACAHHQEVKIALHSLWYHHSYRWPSRARNKTYCETNFVHQVD